MNKLIIIGNGFDLSHGLKTTYCDFIEHYWSKVTAPHKDRFYTINPRGVQIPLQGQKSKKAVFEVCSQYGVGKVSNPSGKGICVHNSLFDSLCDSHSSSNWVDIEVEYYRRLQKCLENSTYIIDSEEKKKNVLERVKILNLELLAIIQAFDQYLLHNVISQSSVVSVENYRKIFEDKESADYSIMREFAKRYHNEILDLYRLMSIGEKSTVFSETIILDFNYTPTVEKYVNMMPEPAAVIYIHGECENTSNPINMGFGNETHDFYKRPEEANEREFLRFMKSFQYTNNDGYRRLFDFLESDKFQVQILGHSCGLSDRTLLTAIFEHINCGSIKFFYHKFKEPNKYGEMDNYLEIVTNISRHFDKKVMMRDRIVNKGYCTEIPQI